MGMVKLVMRYSLMAATGEEPGFTPIQIINQLSCLPSNTKIVGFEEVNSFDLSRTFHILISNPIFQDLKETPAINWDWQYERTIAFNEDGKLIEFNKPSGLNLDKVLRRMPPLKMAETPTPMTPEQEAATKEYVDRVSTVNVEELKQLHERIRLGSFPTNDDNGK